MSARRPSSTHEVAELSASFATPGLRSPTLLKIREPAARGPVHACCGRSEPTVGTERYAPPEPR